MKTTPKERAKGEIVKTQTRRYTSKIKTYKCRSIVKNDKIRDFPAKPEKKVIFTVLPTILKGDNFSKIGCFLTVRHV